METWYRPPAWQVLGWQQVRPLPDERTQVVVVGGGLSGCAAATAAARRGVRTVLVEPLHLLGGQMSARGVGAGDTYASGWETTSQGLWKEVMDRVRRIHDTEMDGKATDTNGYQSPTFAANAIVVDRALTEMLFEAGVEVFRNCPVTAATATDRGATVTAGGTLACDVVVDATEDGSVLALTGVTHRMGNAVVAGGVPSRPYDQINIQDITWPAVVRRYDDGVPPRLRWTGPALSSYPQYREGVARRFPQKPWDEPGDTNGFAGFRGLPDIGAPGTYSAAQTDLITRTSLNYTNDLAVKAAYHTDEAYRFRMDRIAIDRTLAIIYYLQVELGLPWAVAEDEGFAEGPPSPARDELLRSYPAWARHLALAPYIRESRRLVGVTTMTYGSVGRTATTMARWQASTVAVGHYPFDMHGSVEPDDFEAELGETEFPPVHPGAFPIPFEALVPPTPVRLIAAEKNLSASRTVCGGVRVHPSVTAVGQAAGIIAAGVVKLATAPRDVPVTAVQYALLEEGALLLPAPVAGQVSGEDLRALSLALLSDDPVAMLDARRTSVQVPTSRLPGLLAGGTRTALAAKGRI